MESADLIANHIAFLASHRGEIVHEPDLARCVSDKAAFCFAIILAPSGFAASRPDETLYIPSFLTRDMPDPHGRKKSHALSYMVRATGDATPLASARRMTSANEIEIFSEVQARGFCDDEQDYNEWKPWMQAANLRNRDNPKQSFFVAYDPAAPAACSLSIYEAGIAGIYAVATVPAHRRKGLASALLSHAAAEAARNGYTKLGLQTVCGSDAERLYSGAGFESLFRMNVFQPV